MVWRLIRRLPVTAISNVCNLVASTCGIWLRRWQISPAPEIPGSVDLIPGSVELIPSSPEKLPGYLPTGIRQQELDFACFFLQNRGFQGQNRKNSRFFRLYGNLPIAVGPRIDLSDRLELEFRSPAD
jgi:hypothetical protein